MGITMVSIILHCKSEAGRRRQGGDHLFLCRALMAQKALLFGDSKVHEISSIEGVS